MKLTLLPVLITVSTMAFTLADHAVAEPASFAAEIESITKPGLTLKKGQVTSDLSVMRLGLVNMQQEILDHLSEFYDKRMVDMMLESTGESDGNTVPTKAWWDSICDRIDGAAPEDVNAQMTTEEIEAVFSRKIMGAKEKTLADVKALLHRAVNAEWAKAQPFGFAANCDLNSSPPYNWSDSVGHHLGEESDRTDSQRSSTQSIASWDMMGDATAKAVFAWTPGKASFRRKHEGVETAIVELEVDSVSTVSCSVNIGIGANLVKMEFSRTVNTVSTGNSDVVEYKFSNE
ncbi:MAG: hypothetical protein P1U86_21280 [Verrucomicrobiales bacterium]|nr:hypothetical protein [Verrucomicrobiales bacterium]